MAEELLDLVPDTLTVEARGHSHIAEQVAFLDNVGARSGSGCLANGLIGERHFLIIFDGLVSANKEVAHRSSGDSGETGGLAPVDGEHNEQHHGELGVQASESG